MSKAALSSKEWARALWVNETARTKRSNRCLTLSRFRCATAKQACSIDAPPETSPIRTKTSDRSTVTMHRRPTLRTTARLTNWLKMTIEGTINPPRRQVSEASSTSTSQTRCNTKSPIKSLSGRKPRTSSPQRTSLNSLRKLTCNSVERAATNPLRATKKASTRVCHGPSRRCKEHGNRTMSSKA